MSDFDHIINAIDGDPHLSTVGVLASGIASTATLFRNHFGLDTDEARACAEQVVQHYTDLDPQLGASLSAMLGSMFDAAESY